MHRTRIKICGIRTLQDATTAVHAGVDAIGLVFVSGSPRHISLATAKQIIDQLPPFVEPIGLFADAPTADILDIAHELNLRTVQLHGQETIDTLKAIAPLRAIKALPYHEQLTRQSLASWSTAASNLSGLLIDAPTPSNANLLGGHGQPGDWLAIRRILHDEDHASPSLPSLAPVILAGGLMAENVRQAIATVRPYAVDVSSGVEASRGIKDATKIYAFCQAVRLADASLIGDVR